MYRLLENTADGFGVPIFLPVFRQPKGEENELIGFVLGIIQVADILERALKYVDPIGINIQVFDDSAPEGRRNLFYYQSRLAGRIQTDVPQPATSGASTLLYSSATEVAGRRWRVVCTPTQEFLDAAASLRPWVVLAVGVLAMFAVSTYFVLNLIHTARTDRLVEELSRTNEQLNHEIGGRIRVEEHLAVARDQAVEGSRLKSQFLANMSHEIRTPMNGIIGMNSLLLTTPLSPEQREYAETVERSGQALLAIINDILDFSKIESGKLSIESISFNLRRSINHVIGDLSEQAKNKNIALKYSDSAQLPEVVRGDPTRLGQVLNNLVGNAIKFTEQGEVSVTASVLEPSDACFLLRFEIKDTGVGIPAEAQKLIFQSFSQVDGSSTRKYGGTGLGLSISKQLVEMMQGDIGFESKVGVGSTFWFTVRLEAPQAGSETYGAARDSSQFSRS
jgi:signal transduction histidine kinase